MDSESLTATTDTLDTTDTSSAHSQVIVDELRSVLNTIAELDNTIKTAKTTHKKKFYKKKLDKLKLTARQLLYLGHLSTKSS